jgi:septal ring factor EnvC (AmiA/AmiB activator)
VASTLVEVYLAEHVRLNSNPGAYQFFDEQTRLLKTQLDEAIARLRDAKSRFQLASIEGRRGSLQEQMTAVERQILDTQASLSATKAKIDAYQKTLAQFPEPLVHDLAAANRATGSMRGQL